MHVSRELSAIAGLLVRNTVRARTLMEWVQLGDIDRELFCDVNFLCVFLFSSM